MLNHGLNLSAVTARGYKKPVFFLKDEELNSPDISGCGARTALSALTVDGYNAYYPLPCGCGR
jgi:hypothetical protein